MSIQTIYKCDKCHVEQPTKEQFWEVEVRSKCLSKCLQYSGFSDCGSVAKGHSMHVCRKCLESFGIHVTKKPEQPAPPAPTLEDLIREIVRQEQPQAGEQENV